MLWLPEFLRRSRSAREALAVLVSPQQVKDGLLSPERYLAEWEAKVDRLMEARKQEQPGSVRLDLGHLGPPGLELYRPGRGEPPRASLGNHHNLKGGLSRLLRYLRNQSQEYKADLLALYPQEERALSPQQELQEQENLQFIDLLLSL